MKKQYDFVFLTNTPSFYKINLCNRIALTHSVLLVLYGYGAEAVNTALNASDHYHFDYVFLHKGNSEERNRFVTFWKLIRLMQKIRAKKILYAGWFIPEYNLFSFLSSKKKNCVVCESSAIESAFTGLRGLVKKWIINRMSVALASGELQKEIFDNIGYRGQVYLTGGVGIFNKQLRKKTTRQHPENKKYLYVGRLIDCKNLIFLIQEFNRNGKSLTLVGAGEQEHELKKMAQSNISFLGFVPNEQLPEIYQAHDVFILPSKSEVWGLVLEEAIYWGLPVIVSDHVGSYKDLVLKHHTGCVFELDNADSFRQAIDRMEADYDTYRSNVEEVDFEQRDRLQVRAYTQLIKE